MSTIKTDCRFFKGDIPCIFHKKFGVKCKDCKYYDKVREKILIIKLGAAGDVIRTTPILRKIKEDFPQSEIFWLTYFPKFIPSLVDNILDFNLKNVLWLQSQEFDYLFNLDKDKEACSLTNMIKAKIKKGFVLKDGKCSPVDDLAIHKWKTGIWDDVSQKNKKSYQEEIFELCGFAFNKEEYILDVKSHTKWPAFHRPLIGLNTGCGDRWKTREWPEKSWIELANKFKKEKYGVIILGGQKEHNKSKKIAEESGAQYLGHFDIKKFIDLVNQCDLVVTTVTMALHIAIALKKKVLLYNNVFNRNEFELYGLGEILEPNVPCLGCYRSSCDLKFNGKKCIELINISEVIKKCRQILRT